MILDTLAQSATYTRLNSGLKAAFEFLQQPDLANLADGRYDIDGDRVYAMISRQSTRPADGAKLEAHQRYLDIHYLIAGQEQIGWKTTPDCIQPDTGYDSDKDIQFFLDSADSWVTILPGQFAIVFPNDAHIPLVGTGNLHKIVLKILV